MSTTIRPRSADLDAVEVAWFSTLCDDDYEYLGVPRDDLRSSWEHCRDIVLMADEAGYQNVLLPSGYVAGQDTLTFAGGMAALVQQIQLLVAIRCGEYHPPMLARAISSLDHMLKGRLTINIISSDMPGTRLESEARYQRSREVIQILKQAWTQERIDFKGDHYEFRDLPTKPVRPYQQNGGPLLYFGGISPAARDLCAEQCDVFLMWPETGERLRATMEDMTERAAKYERTIDYGLRIHVIVRESEREARAAADKLVSRLDDAVGSEIKNRSMDAKSAGVQRQDSLREQADSDGYIEPHIWSGIGRARSGCGSAIVGDPDQVLAKIREYIELGMRSFIFSGYPHLDEGRMFADYVLPRLKTCRLPVEQGRVVAESDNAFDDHASIEPARPVMNDDRPDQPAGDEPADSPPTGSAPHKQLLSDRAPWYAGITRYQWIVLIIASLGWIFDVYEGQIFVSTMKEMMDEFLGVDASEGDKNFYKNLALAAFLLGGSLGGVLFGMLSDKIGRARTMVFTILMYSCFTCVSALAQNEWQMAALRFFVAMGVGGEWAVASAMVAEVFPRRARAWSLGIFHASSVFGTFLAVGAGALVAQGAPWRVAFLLGAIPALLTIWVRVSLKEPERWVAARKKAEQDDSQQTGRVSELFSKCLRNTLVGVSLAAIGLATFWGVHIYGKNLMRNAAERTAVASAPEDASEAEIEAIKADQGTRIKNMEMMGMLLAASGGGLGLIAFGPISERLGRRGAFLFYHLGGFAIALFLFQFAAQASEGTYYLLLPLFGFLTLGMHAGYAIYFPELFPTRLRGTGGGFCFNVGRIIAAPILLLGGWMQKGDQPLFTLEQTASLLSFLFLLAIVVLIFAPETRNRELPE